MSRIYSGFELLGRSFGESITASDNDSYYVLLDVPIGYALIKSSFMPRPYLVITGNSCPLYLRDLLRHEPEGLIVANGAVGFDQIERSALEVAEGRQVYMGPSLHEPSKVSSKERHVVRLVALGCDNQAIAQELGVSEKTVRNVISRITAKLGLKNRVELCHFYLGLFPDVKDAYPD